MSDQQLLAAVTNAAPATIADVIDLMEKIETTFESGDGLKWFNFLYLAVTREIRDHPPAGGWAREKWLTQLDVNFAGFYFAAIEAFLKGDSGLASSWNALFEARHKSGIDRIQFALAGMNAHINHDLSLALIQTNRQFGIQPSLASPEHDDFERVNSLLETVTPTVLQTLATGLVGEAVQDSGKIGRLLAFWSVSAARDLAWDFGDHLTRLDDLSRQFAIDAQDKITGALGRSLLAVIV
jgi:hypothetical protein